MNVNSIFITLVLVISLAGLSFAQNVRWYVGGSFNYTQGSTSVPSSPNIVALDETTNQYVAIGSGANGAVFALGRDVCNNLYAGGVFTTANGVSTGPLAQFTQNSNTFTSIGSSNTLLMGSTILSLVADCGGTCTCNLWIGGAFNFTASDGYASNIAYYQASTNKWFSLGGISTHGLYGTVSALARDSNGVIYAGGVFPGLIKSFTPSGTAGQGSWSASMLMTGATIGSYYTIPPVTALISSITTVTLGGNVAVYVGGNFKYNSCNYVCAWYSNKWNVLGINNLPNGPVFSLSYDNSTRLYIAGNFTAGSAQNVAITTLSSSQLSGNDWSQAGGSLPFAPFPPVYTISALDPSQYGFTAGSFGVGTFGGFGLFYDADVRIWFPFGTATGFPFTNLYTVMVPTPKSASSALTASIPLLVLCISTLLLFFY